MYIYKMTRNNGEYYIGKRVTDINPTKDSYTGSGTLFLNKFLGYEDQWVKEILECCNSNMELNDRESHWIGDLWKRDSFNDGGLCLNLCSGGDGGFTRLGNSSLLGVDRTVSQKRASNAHSKRMSGRVGRSLTKTEKENLSDRMRGTNNPMWVAHTYG